MQEENKKNNEIFELASEWFHSNLQLKENIKSFRIFKKKKYI